MPSKKKKEKENERGQLGGALKQVFVGALRLARLAARVVWPLPALIWKAWFPYLTSHWGKRTQAERIRLRTTLALGVVIGLVAGVVIPAVTTRPGDPSCALREQVDNAFIQQYWPNVRQWCLLITRASETYHLDPYLIAAMILYESGGDPHAYSRYGAVGLMQVMPRDGLATGFDCPTGPCFAHRPTISELEDPAFNINYGSQLLAYNLERTGSVRDALRDYGPINAGYSYADAVLSIYEAIKP